MFIKLHTKFDVQIAIALKFERPTGQQCCWLTCNISGWWEHFKYKFQGSETFWDLNLNHLISLLWYPMSIKSLVLDCSFNSLFTLMTKKSSKVHIIGPSWRESTSHWWIPLTKGQYCRTLTYHGHWKVSLSIKSLLLDCYSNSLFRVMTKKSSKVRITGPLWRESTSDWWIPLTKGQ